MDRPFHTEVDVPVSGGHLRVAVAGPTGRAPVALAVHGITGSHRAWSAVARHTGQDVTVIAPDLRGRGASGQLGGPFGMAAHAADLVAVLDHMGVTSAVVAGHSMGGYVATRLAAMHPGRVSGIVLVDGGLPLPVPAGTDPDALLEAVLGPALARLRMTFPDREAYRDFWRRHPAFSAPGAWNADVEDYVDYDLGGDGGELRSRVAEDAVRGDGRDVLDQEAATLALAGVAAPATLLRAPRGLLDEPNPFLPDAAVGEARRQLPDLVEEMVSDTNHYLIVLGDREAAVVADHVRRAAAGG